MSSSDLRRLHLGLGSGPDRLTSRQRDGPTGPFVTDGTTALIQSEIRIVLLVGAPIMRTIRLLSVVTLARSSGSTAPSAATQH